MFRSASGPALRGLAAAGAAALTLLIAAPGYADGDQPRFTQVDQVSNQPGAAKITDANVVNAWGLALSPTSPLWVANNGTNTATLYSGGQGGAAVTKVGLTVTIAGGAPTGEVFNDTTGFVLTNSQTTPPVSGPARFMFASEEGDITAWNPAVTGTTAVVVAHHDGAVYKGLALAHTSMGNFLLATDFAGGHVDVYDTSFHLVTLPDASFQDRHLPAGYAPFGVLTVGDNVFVSYAKQVPGSEDEAHGQGLGIVDEYSGLGQSVRRIATRGQLNAPWGMAVAPAGFGSFAGALLVGNFGDGHINVYRGDELIGQLRDASGHKIAIDGLWGLLPGTANTGGVGTVWFSAGPNDESDGLVGQLIPIG